MKKKAGRLTAVIICLAVLAVSAAACSGRQQPDSAADLAPNPPVTLRYTSYLLDSAQAGKVYHDAIAEFERRYPDIRIETDFIQNAYYTSGIKTRLLGGVKLDVFDTWSPSLFTEIRRLGEDIYLDLSDSVFLDEFLPSSLELVTIDGKVYGVPEVMHSDGLLYNKGLFDELGLRVPQTWDEFLQVCDALKEAGLIPIALDSEWWVPQFFFGSLMTNNGADAEWTAKLESGEVPVTDPIFVDALEKTKEIITRGYVPEAWFVLKHEQSKDLFGQGEAAMMIAGTWDISSVMERDPNLDIDFMMVPGESRTVPNINIGTYRVISSETKHPEEAKLFVAFMNGKANQEKLAFGALAVPSVKGYEVDNPIVQKIDAFVTRDDAALYWPHTVSTETLQVKILEEVNRYLAGEPLDVVLAAIQSDIDEARR